MCMYLAFVCARTFFCTVIQCANRMHNNSVFIFFTIFFNIGVLKIFLFDLEKCVIDQLMFLIVTKYMQYI